MCVLLYEDNIYDSRFTYVMHILHVIGCMQMLA
uniref:Uncharacterized protein n=1 Tax=Rhizophora mucronata TaxID=61149 RepID=A0A2P2QIF6_RHIMU